MSHYGSSYGPSRGSSGHDTYRYAPYSTNRGHYSQSSSNLGGSYGGNGGHYSSSSRSRGYHASSTSSLMNMGGGSSYGGHSSYNSHSGGGGGGRSGRRGGPRSEFGIAYGQAGAGLRSVDWSQQQLPPFQKNFYREAATVTQMTEEDVSRWRKEKDMTVLGKNIPRPIRSFEEAGFPEYIMAELRKAGFQAPTAIQSQGWPMAMSGRDIVGIARTGSGKTLGFLLPSIVHINAQPLLRANDGPIVLIIAPTRELAVQIEGEARKFAASSKIKHTCVYGGVPRREQARVLKSGVEIVICTPGRLLDFLESGTTNLRRVTYLVIDEADRLLDMGFEPQLKAIMSQVRPDKQILMWSATWPEDVRVLAHDFLKGEIMQVAIGSFDTCANTDVTQVIEVMQQYEKQGRLFNLLREYLSKTTVESPTKILVFTATKRTCDSLTRMLKTDQWPATSIHGDKQQYDRDQALSDFKHGKCPIMLATDVASRGIHVDDITVVINFDMPGNIEDYVHRIGRTGRCGKKGIAISFFTRDDAKRAGKLISVLSKADQRVPPELIALKEEFAPSGSGRGRGRGGKGGRSGGSSSSSSSSMYGSSNGYHSTYSDSRGNDNKYSRQSSNGRSGSHHSGGGNATTAAGSGAGSGATASNYNTQTQTGTNMYSMATQGATGVTGAPGQHAQQYAAAYQQYAANYAYQQYAQQYAAAYNQNMTNMTNAMNPATAATAAVANGLPNVQTNGNVPASSSTTASTTAAAASADKK